MKAGLAERVADGMVALLTRLMPYLPLLDDPAEAAAFLGDFDVVVEQARQGAGVVPILTTIARLAARLRDRAVATGQSEAATQLARIEAVALRFRDRWLHHVDLRRRRR